MKLLYINCCISIHEVSRTKALADAFLYTWRNAHPGDQVETVDLRTMPLLPLNEETLRQRESLMMAGKTDDEAFALARQFADADRIVIAAPFWELSFPAQLRTYIELISAAGITFTYTDHGEEGCCKAEKLLFLTTAGGPLEGRNCGSAHLEALSQLYGIPHYTCLGAPMQDVIEMDHEAILKDVLSEAEALAKTF